MHSRQQAQGYHSCQQALKLSHNHRHLHRLAFFRQIPTCSRFDTFMFLKDRFLFYMAQMSVFSLERKNKEIREDMRIRKEILQNGWKGF